MTRSLITSIITILLTVQCLSAENILLLDFERDAVNTSPRRSLGTDPQGVRVLNRAQNPDGIVDCSTIDIGSPLDGGERSLLFFDASKSGARAEANIAFAPQKDTPIVVSFDLCVNAIRTSGDTFVFRVFAGPATACGIRLTGDGKQVTLTDIDGKQVSASLLPMRWYRIAMKLSAASAAVGAYKIRITDGISKERRQFDVYAKRDSGLTDGYSRIGITAGYAPSAEADVALDNIRVSTAEASEESSADADAGTTLKETIAMTESEALKRFPALAWEERSDWMNVRTDNPITAKGDGKADDTAALQFAFTIAGNGSTIYIPAGVYRITKTLELKVPSGGTMGLRLIGHGRDTRIVWDGEKDGSMLIIRGTHRSRYTGIVWDGRGIAGTGIEHNAIRFETQNTHEHEAFLGFTIGGIRVEPTRKQASAEFLYYNCLFESCGRGISFFQFNEYDNTVDGCEFIGCGMGIEDVHGNFYVRNSRFEKSSIADISMQSEHASSVRRSVSIGSKLFVDMHASVSPMTIENCAVSGWTGTDGAVKAGGAPLTIFDCSFTRSPDGKPPVAITLKGQRIIASGNRANGPLVRNTGDGIVYDVPGGDPSPGVSADEHFLKPDVPMPGRIFDAKRDFGAKGDGNTDDTRAVQRTIDAARENGKKAIAYFPAGKYAVSDTIRVTGKDYLVGGSGVLSQIAWKGKPEGTIMSVHDPLNVTLENIAVVSDDAAYEADIRQTGSGAPSSMTYDMVFVFGCYAKQPGKKGLRLENLSKNALVHIKHLQGNIIIDDCAQATILANTSYEGIITIGGKSRERGGFLGFLTRLGTHAQHNLYVNDSHSVVMSDFYIEQADNGFLFTGSRGDVPGRITIAGAKMGTMEGPVTMKGYAGEVFIGHHQYYMKPNPMVFSVDAEYPSTLYIIASMFYSTVPSAQTSGKGNIYLFGNHSKQLADAAVIDGSGADDSPEKTVRSAVRRSFDDFRRLGSIDRRINHGR